ncbi:formate/nitrite transporter family protein [Vibrio cyclitrophicus]|uniref:formate/nitrite transporter family protein n=1 Tax=Vibrio cyclitrophicus TaxID=47951 RepID=UPI00049223A5|nr:hypothetical protein OAC_15730 [Vibrio cyclitrophicus 1F273]PMO90369.1 hypothetical protein BCS97_23000 [Vibrio splendidus]PMP27983.1 hypothetical protein BCS88_21305 [Vibrio splendidus]PMP28199.1 hypothetical protein BCS89_08745 [Vibrio splendidus]PMP41419.1 hypothetical protein BCS86_16755 [Vibrio splendidus]
MGISVILIMVLGNDVPPEFRVLVIGATFAITLALVMFTGAELFTSYTMYTTFGVLKKRITVSRAVLTKSPDTVLQLIAHKKMNASAVQLFLTVFCVTDWCVWQFG